MGKIFESKVRQWRLCVKSSWNILDWIFQFILSIDKWEPERGSFSQREHRKERQTHLSKEPYITFSVRTTSPTTVCKYSRGTLEGNGNENGKTQTWMNFDFDDRTNWPEAVTQKVIDLLLICFFLKHGWNYFSTEMTLDLVDLVA